MRQRWIRGLVIALYGGLLTACGGGTTSSGFFEVAITEERLETVQGNLCAVKGHGTNIGNVRAHVELRYEALNATGGVIGTSTASFDVAPFSNFDFSNSGGNSSTTFSNGLACAGISNFRRSNTDIAKA